MGSDHSNGSATDPQLLLAVGIKPLLEPGKLLLGFCHVFPRLSRRVSAGGLHFFPTAEKQDSREDAAALSHFFNRPIWFKRLWYWSRLSNGNAKKSADAGGNSHGEGTPERDAYHGFTNWRTSSEGPDDTKQRKEGERG